jgi:hypothetical protein
MTFAGETTLDTCRILHACATIDDPKSNRGQDSPLDREVRELGINPKDIRKEIQDLFTSKRLLIPKTIEQELQDHLLESNPKLNEKNRGRLKHLLSMFKGRIVEVATTTADYEMQKKIFAAIEKDAEKRVRKIEIKTNSNLEGWEEKPQEACRSPLLREIYKDPVCKTWQKIKNFKDDVINTARGLKPKNPFFLNDLQIILIAKKRKALISTHDGDIKVLLAAYNQILQEEKLHHSALLPSH